MSRINDTELLLATLCHFGLTSSAQVIQTSEAGDKLSEKPNVKFNPGSSNKAVSVRVRPEFVRQTLYGIGTSFTESSAFVLAHLDETTRSEVMTNIFGPEGANFSMARTPIGATDFSVEGRYSYDDVPNDTSLDHFSIDVDSDGFDLDKYPQIKNPSYDLLPMIKQALAIKERQRDPTLHIIASAWTAPAWMKDIGDWYQPGSPSNAHNGTGGELKTEHQSTYARYLIKYLDAYLSEGVRIWGLTPVNEPLGNNGQWESMHFSARSQRDFIKYHLGPALRNSAHKNIQHFVLDHSRTHLEEWADVIFSDKECAELVSGAAVHWYESSYKVFESEFERVHRKYPQFSIIHTEGCIDDLGKDAPEGIVDPDGYKESGWFDNDSFWWNANATDWAYSAEWPGVNAADHPIYTPVHRYARNIIVSLNHWVRGWIDWNIVLDERGGPNHVGNYCGAPIMIDKESGQIHYTPIFHVLSQFSRTIRPGDRAVATEVVSDLSNQDAIHACATVNDRKILTVQVLNTTKEPVEFALDIGSQHSVVEIDANALQSICISLA